MLANASPAEVTNYVTSDDEVKTLRDDIAVLAHNADGYRSLHVFEKTERNCQVVATATIPMADN